MVICLNVCLGVVLGQRKLLVRCFGNLHFGECFLSMRLWVHERRRRMSRSRVENRSRGVM